MKWYMTALLAITVAATAAAQETTSGMGGYSGLRLDEVGVFIGGFDGRIDRMSDGVKITLLSDDPAKKPLPMSANQMKFTWPKEGGKQPSRIEMEGKVVIEHPQATVRADKADWDFEKGVLTFTGSPVMNTEQVQDLRGEKVVLYLKEDRFEVHGGRAKEIKFGEIGAEGAATTSLLREADVLDWSAFLTRIKESGTATTPSPGRQLVSLMDPRVKQALGSTDVKQLLAQKAKVVQQVNRALASPKLYDAAAWQGVDLGQEVKDLLGKGALDAKAQLRLNRLLLEAAYPDLVAKAPKESPAAATPAEKKE